MTDFELFSRVAWLNRDTNEYNYGAWHPLNQKNPKEYKNLQIWIQEQNKKYPRKDGYIKYNGKWVEEGNKNFPWEKRAYKAADAALKKIKNGKEGK